MTLMAENGEAVDDFAGLSRCQRILLLASFVLVNFFACTMFSVLGPFFPPEALQKGLSLTTIGIIVGVMELAIFIACPLIGLLVTKANVILIYSSGLFICSICSVSFGLLEYCPPGIPFAVLCIVIRAICGVGTAMFIVSSSSIAIKAFPTNISMVFGSFETATGAGYMIGPLVGGFLFQVGGFKMPFIVLACLLIVTTIASLIVMPTIDSDLDEEASTGSMISFLKLPYALVILIALGCCTSLISFIDVSFQQFFSKNYHFSPIGVGVVLFLVAISYSLSAVFWGWITDNHGLGLLVSLLGQLSLCVSTLLLVPAPFIPYSLNKVSTFACIVALGFSCSAVIIPAMNLLATESYTHGFPRNLATYSLLSGLINSAYSLGTFVGPTVGGALLDRVSLGWVLTGYSGLFLASALIFLLVPVRINGSFKRKPTNDMSLIGDDADSETELQTEYTVWHTANV